MDDDIVPTSINKRRGEVVVPKLVSSWYWKLHSLRASQSSCTEALSTSSGSLLAFAGVGVKAGSVCLFAAS